MTMHTQFLFFFQAEAGIRALIVTGVQTCALPISDGRAILGAQGEGAIPAGVGDLQPDRVRAQVHHRQRDDLRAAPHPDMRKSTIEGTSGRTSTGLPEWSVSR